MNTILIENNMNIEQKSAKQYADNFASDNKNDNKDFSNVLNSKKINQVTNESTKEKEPQTLSNLKIDTDSEQKRTKIANFKEILTKAAGEISVENALDLTLKRDISDIINQIKDIVQIDDENTKYADLTDVVDIVDNKTDNKDEEKDIAVLTGIIMLNQEQNDNINSLQVEQIEQINQTAKTEINFDEKAPIKDILKEELSEDKRDLSELGLDNEMVEELNIEYMGSESGLTGEDDSMSKQSPEEYGVKAMLNHNDSKSFELNLINGSSKSLNAQNISPDKIIEQITKQIDSMKSFAKVNIILNPASLGRVDLQIINTKEGLSAQFTVTTNEARELLMKGLDGLKESLLAHGVGVDNVSVKISETEETSYNDDWTEQDGSRGGNKEGGEPRKDEKEKGLFEKTIAQTLKYENGSV